jgi:hypothetical protein
MDSRNRDVLRIRNYGLKVALEKRPAIRSDAQKESRRPPQLVPLFPIEPFTPQSTCPHHAPIRRGSVFCCMVCSCSGMDDHTGLQRDPKTDPTPEPKPKTAPPVMKPAVGRDTRKQRRRRLFAAHRVATQQAAADEGSSYKSTREGEP